MSKLESPTTRRELLLDSGRTIAACGIAGALSSPPGVAAPQTPALPMRKLGKTGLDLPILGFGGAALPTVWGNPLSRQGRVELVHYAYDRGIRYYDTAPASYMESQSILGEALQDRRRNVCLVTKIDTTLQSEVCASVESSLKELRTDYMDIVLIHGTPGLQQMTVEQAMKIHAELLKLRDQKMLRFIGFSAHGYFDKALALIETGGFDQCMLSYGYIPRGYDQIWTARMTELRNACIARAHARGMGIVAMKVVGAGMLGAWAPYIVTDFDPKRAAGLPDAAIRWTLQDERIDLLNIGMRLKPEIDANIRAITGPNKLTTADRTLLAEYSAKLYSSEAVRKLKIE